MPKEGETIEFNNWNHKYKSDVTGFLDFETVQIEDPKNSDVKTLKAYQYSLLFVDKFNNLLFEERKFCGKGEAAKMCLDTLLDIEDRLFSHARRKKKMKMTKTDIQMAKNAKSCHICEEKFEDGQKGVRDHCHYSSKFLG